MMKITVTYPLQHMMIKKKQDNLGKRKYNRQRTRGQNCNNTKERETRLNIANFIYTPEKAQK